MEKQLTKTYFRDALREYRLKAGKKSAPREESMRIPYCEPEGHYVLGRGKYARINAKAVLIRLTTATGARSELDLAGWLGVRRSRISDVKRRNIFPAKWLYLLLERRTHYNPVWVLTGEGEAYAQEWRLTAAGLRAVIPASHTSCMEPGLTAPGQETRQASFLDNCRI